MPEGTDSRSYPGGDLIRRGLGDLEQGIESVESLLVSVGAPRLKRIGLAIPCPIESPEHRLYRLLGERHGNAAHSRYNALVRRLVSFESTAAKVGPRADLRGAVEMRNGSRLSTELKA